VQQSNIKLTLRRAEPLSFVPVYLSYQLQRGLQEPLHFWATLNQALWTSPGVAEMPFARSLAAASELLERSTRFYRKPAFGLPTTSVAGEVVSVTEVREKASPFCELLHFRKDTASPGPKVLIVAPLSGHHATLLRETVQELLPGHDVYLTDWVDARLVPVSQGGFDLDDYIALVQGFLLKLGPDVHVVSVCQPAVAVLAALSLLAEDAPAAAPRSVTLMAGPVDTSVHPTDVNLQAEKHSLAFFERWAVDTVPATEAGAGRRVCPGFVQLTGFVSMNVDKHVKAHWKLFQDVLEGDEGAADVNRRFYDEYLAVMDLPAEYYLQTVRTVFQENALAKGTMQYRGTRLVRPGAITRTALLTVEGEKDDITGLGQTLAAHALCTGIASVRKEHHQQPGAGHYGVFSGRRWRGEVAPRIRDFIRRHDRPLAD
jgi:poly(3-hydroxybutyrate) depolymerase